MQLQGGGNFKHLLNLENESDGRKTGVTQSEDAQHTIIESFKLAEVAKQVNTMQNNKACGLDGEPKKSFAINR